MDSSPLNDLRQACARPLPHPDVETLRAFGQETLDWLLHHHATLPEQSAFRTATRAEMEALLREPPPEMGKSFDAVLAEFAGKVAPFACRTNHPRFLAFIPAAPTFLSILGEFLCAGTNFFAGAWRQAAGPAQVEAVVLDWLRDFLGLPPTSAGVLTSGGSEANLTALVVARERLAEADRARAVLYTGELRHGSIDRAVRIMGLRAEQLHVVAADAAFRLSPAALAAACVRDREAGLLPWAVVASAGATSTGTVDPLPELAEVCRQQQLWLHVDAAYGWAACLTAAGREALAGIDCADSVTLDPHKWLAQTYDVGGVLVREGALLARTFAFRPDYLEDVEPASDEVNYADHGLALTRRFRALKIWLSLKVLGVSWFRELVAHGCRLARYAQALLEASGDFEILSPAQLSIVCFRHLHASVRDAETLLNQHNRALVEAVRGTGRAFLSTTRLRGRLALRLSFVNWRTTAADVDEVIELLRVLGQQSPVTARDFLDVETNGGESSWGNGRVV